MDYEKAYKEALEQAKFYYGNCPSESEKKKLEKMFPVLKENKDEMIRKAIGAAICGTTAETVLEANGVKLVDALAYLEKQKEQKPAKWSKEDEKMLNMIEYRLKDWDNIKTRQGYQTDYTKPSPIKWLKSLRPQSHWKPSKEQLNALHAFVGMIRPDARYDAVLSLLNDLQKLL